MTTTRTFSITSTELAAQGLPQGIGSAIAWAEAQVDADEYAITDVTATPMQSKVAATRGQHLGWNVRFEVEYVGDIVEVPTHPVVVRGGHSLYCTTCDEDVARLTGGPVFALRSHEREVRSLIASGVSIQWQHAAL